MSRDYTIDTPMSDEENEFAAMFAEGASTGTVTPELQKGQMISGRLISIGAEVSFIDLGGKAEGVIDTAELEELEPKVGDVIEAMVLNTRGEIRLSRTLAGAARNREMLEEAYRMGLPVEGRINERNKGGFDVAIGGVRAFMPVSHLDIDSIEDLDAWLGRTERFKIIEFGENGKRVVVSRAQLIREEREQLAEATWETLKVGQVIQGTVRSVRDFGCFVDIGGVDGLVHITKMKWGRVEHRSDLVSTGDTVTVTVTEIDLDKKRVGLSMKSAGDDPWLHASSSVNVGDLVQGEVTRTESFGVFVEIKGGLEGLVHISELTWTKRVRHPRDIVTVGEQVTVTVLDLDTQKQRISLSMKQVQDDPWSDIEQRYKVGAEVTGKVEKSTGFGVFVEIEPGVTALLPKSETHHGQDADLSRKYRSGDSITGTIISIEADTRKMSLSLIASAQAAEAANVSDYQKRQDGGSGAGFGTFADLLKNVKVDD